MTTAERFRLIRETANVITDPIVPHLDRAVLYRLWEYVAEIASAEQPDPDAVAFLRQFTADYGGN